MTTSSCDGQNNPPALPRILVEIPPPLACLHCAATQASVRRDRQILVARLGYPADCVCCDCETTHACPQCLGENLEYGAYDFGTDRETGYADSGERYYCRNCGAAGDLQREERLKPRGNANAASRRWRRFGRRERCALWA